MISFFKTYWPYLRPFLRVFIFAMTAGVIAGVISGSAIPYYTEKVFAQIFKEHDSGHSLSYIIFIAAQLPAIFIIRGVSSYLNQYWMTQCGMEILRSVRQNIFDQLQRFPLAFFEKNRSGDLISRLLADTGTVQSALLSVARDCIQQPVTIICGIGYLTYLSFQSQQIIFLLVILVMAPFVILPVRLIGRHLKTRGQQVQEVLGEATNTLQENLRGVMEIRAFNLEENQKKRFRERLASHFIVFMKLNKYDKLSQPLMEIESAILISVAFVYAYYANIEFNTFTSMGAALYFIGDGVKRLVRMLNEIKKSEGASNRILEIINETQKRTDLQDGLLPVPVKGKVRFEQLAFQYDDVPLFQGLSVDIAPGTFCALVGPSGSGKSTFIKLLARFYDPSAGDIYIDDTPLSTVSKASVRNHIAIVPQAPVLFNDTIKENIRVGRADASDEEIIQAATAAYAHEFVSEFPQGYGTLVGENAVRLSGGQKQRIALARAFLRNAPILILDEATSALDSESEKHIQKALTENAKGRTVFVIAHRFSTIQKADRILLFEEGKITGDGNMETLMNHPIFRKLHENQSLS